MSALPIDVKRQSICTSGPEDAKLLVPLLFAQAYTSITQAMRRALADGKGKATAAQERKDTDRFPKRQRTQAVFFSPSKQSLKPCGSNLNSVSWHYYSKYTSKEATLLPHCTNVTNKQLRYLLRCKVSR